MLRTKGWIVPNYPLPPDEGDIEILRVVIRESLTRDMLDRLIDDTIEITEKLKKMEADVEKNIYAPIEHFGEAPRTTKRVRRGLKSGHEKIKKPKTYARTC